MIADRLSLTWSPFCRSDIADLQHFTCTRPPRRCPDGRKVYDRPWEFDVQSLVRDLRVPRGNRRALIGRDSAGLAAVAAWRILQPGEVHLEVIAVAMRLRYCGPQRVGECLIETALEQIAGEANSLGASQVVLTASVDQRNRASQHALTRVGMALYDELDPPWQLWRILLDV